MDDMEVDEVETDDTEVDEVETDDMEVDEIVDVDKEPNDLGTEDYVHLISSNASSSFLCSKKFMTPVSDQLDIDSCVSFTLGAALGALVVVEQHTQDVPEFSKQDMVDCLPIVSGGTHFEKGYDYVLNSGLHMEEDYPYVNNYGVCRCSEIRGRPKHSISRYTFIRRKEEVLKALRHHPLTAGIYLFESFELHYMPYRSRADLLGVYYPTPGEEPCRDRDGNYKAHAVLVVGYGEDEIGGDYFITKNWRGIFWGVNGYARVAAHLLFEFNFGYPSGYRLISDSSMD